MSATSQLLLRCALPGFFAIACTGALAFGKTINVPQGYATIQSGIDAAQRGDTVVVSAGIYNEHVVIAPGVVVRSAGDESKGELGLLRAEKTAIVGRGSEAAVAAVTMSEGSVLDGFSVTGVGKYDEKRWNYHHSTQGNEQPYDHIGAPGIAGVSVKNVNCSVVNNVVHHIGYTGIAIEGVVDAPCEPLIRRNVCYRNMGAGIGSMRHSAALIEENYCFENFYAGIGHDNSSPVVQNNTCFENTRAGIGVSEGACPLIRGNKCYRNRRAGIGTRTGSDTRPIIEDNDCYENEMAGIGIEQEAAPVIRNNRCFKNRLAGIGSRSGAQPLISGNECYQNEAAGIGQESDAVTTLIDNYCHHNRTAGIGFAACASGRSRLTGNRVVDNALVAVGIQSGWDVTLSKNELVRDGGMPPIVMVSDGANVTMTDNVVRGGGVAGIRVAGRLRMVGNRVTGTAMRPAGPPNFAVWGLNGAQITMADNTVRNWRHALHATKATVTATSNSVEGFHQTAFVVIDPARPVTIESNLIVSAHKDARAVDAPADSGIIRDNQVRPPEIEKGDGRP